MEVVHKVVQYNGVQSNLVAEEPQRVGKYGEGLDDVGVDASALGMMSYQHYDYCINKTAISYIHTKID